MSIISDLRTRLHAATAPSAQPSAAQPSTQGTEPVVIEDHTASIELPSMAKLRGVGHGHLVTRGVNYVQDTVVDSTIATAQYGAGFWVGAKLARAEHAEQRAMPKPTVHVVKPSQRKSYEARADLFARAAELRLV